jgi:hypothetical protein
MDNPGDLRGEADIVARPVEAVDREETFAAQSYRQLRL